MLQNACLNVYGRTLEVRHTGSSQDPKEYHTHAARKTVGLDISPLYAQSIKTYISDRFSCLSTGNSGKIAVMRHETTHRPHMSRFLDVFSVRFGQVHGQMSPMMTNHILQIERSVYASWRESVLTLVDTRRCRRHTTMLDRAATTMAPLTIHEMIVEISMLLLAPNTPCTGSTTRANAWSQK